MYTCDVSSVEYPRDIVSRLLPHLSTRGTWQTIHEQERDGSTSPNRPISELVRPIPPEEALRDILDVAYVASLMSEEGRPIHFTLAYLSQAGAVRQGIDVMPFRRPLPLDPSRIAKIALATDPSRASLGVWPGRAGTSEIWGLLHHGDHTFSIDLRHLPTYLSLRVLRPGTFTVHFDSSLALLFSRDHHFLFSHEERHADLVDILRDRAHLQVPVAIALQRLAHRMVLLGHGGTILMIAADQKASALKFHSSLTMKRGKLTLLKEAVEDDWKYSTGERNDRELSAQKQVHAQRKREERHDQALDFVAHLTAVDGAVVLRDDLSIHGFSATITTEGRLPSVTSEHPITGKVAALDLDRTGNRHRSAAFFCARQKGFALALVVSQDGDVSLFARKRKGGVLKIGPFELGVGV